MASCLAPAKPQASSVCWLQSVLLQSRQVLRLYKEANSAKEPAAKGTGRKFTAAPRRRMREVQQLRWAKIKGESPAPAKTATKAAKPKRGITAAGRKVLSIAMKKRWAAKKVAA
jgi:hypothetical protein